MGEDLVLLIFSLDWLPGSELVLHVGELDGSGWGVDLGVGVDLLEGSDLGGDLLEGRKFLLVHSNVQRVGSQDGQRLEFSDSASQVDEDGTAGVKGVGVVQLNGWVAHVQSSHLVASGQVDVLDDQGQSLVRVAEFLGLSGNVHFLDHAGNALFQFLGGRGSLIGRRVGFLGVGVRV